MKIGPKTFNNGGEVDHTVHFKGVAHTGRLSTRKCGRTYQTYVRWHRGDSAYVWGHLLPQAHDETVLWEFESLEVLLRETNKIRADLGLALDEYDPEA
jgi:hypothetical protein